MKSSERSRLFRRMGIIILCLMFFGGLYVCTKKDNQENPGTRADRNLTCIYVCYDSSQ